MNIKKKSIIKIPILYLFFFSYINKNTASTNPITGLNKIKYMKSIISLRFRHGGEKTTNLC